MTRASGDSSAAAEEEEPESMDGSYSRPKIARPGALLALVLAVLMFAGCSPVSPSESARARQATSGPTGGMSFQLPDRPTGFDPFAAPGTADLLLAAAHFEPLISANEGRLMPRMAGWWATVNADRQHLIQIKHGRWSDQQRLGSADLVFTIEQHLRPGSRSVLLPVLLEIDGAREFHAGRADFVRGLMADTSRMVVVTLTDPDPNFIGKLTGLLVLPEHVYAGKDLNDPATFREPMVGSGTYLYSSWADPETVTLTANPLVKPFTRLDRVTGRFVAPVDAVTRMADGTIDVALDIPGRDIGRIPDTHALVGAPGTSLIGLSGRGPLADGRIRQAVAYAVDRRALIDAHLGGRARAAVSALFAPGWAGSPDQRSYPHDPERARTLLAEAGWQPDSELNLVVLSADADPAIWEGLTEQLAAIGVRARITVRPSADRAAVWADPAVHGVIDSYRMPIAEPSLVEPWVSCGAPSGYCNPELDRLLKAGRTEAAPTERQLSYQQADVILAEELPVVGLWVPDIAIAVVDSRGGVSALAQPATALIDFWGPA